MIPRFVVFFFIADVGLVLAYLLDWRLGGLYWKLTAFLDLGARGSLVGWYASAQLFLIAFLWGLFAESQAEQHAGGWQLLLVPALAFAALSLERLVALHEWIGYEAGRFLPAGAFGRDTLYVRDTLVVGLVGLTIVLAVVAMSLRRYFEGRGYIAFRHAVGLIAFAASAIASEPLLRFPGEPGREMARTVIDGLADLLGITLMLWATYDLLCSHAVRLPGSASPPH